ncbi:MAG TPA: hypothetical protein VEX68_28600 [Bryobacteraceae bacterium]|nr:hypothetical protein [Bryobacteraceae bacterium]
MLEQDDPRDNLYGRPRAFVVFISSKMASGALAAEREAAISVVGEFRPARAWAWAKDAPAGSFYSEEEPDTGCPKRWRLLLGVQAPATWGGYGAPSDALGPAPCTRHISMLAMRSSLYLEPQIMDLRRSRLVLE